MAETRYMISDVSRLVDVENHVLRYWEEELELDISRNEMGHRYYTEDDVRKFRKIKDLKDQGYQLKIIKMLLTEVEEQNEDGLNQMSQVNQASKLTQLMPAAKAPVDEAVASNVDKLMQFKMLMKGMITEVLEDNNELLEREVSEAVIKEIDYLLRVKEEADEDRHRQLEELIRSRQMKRGMLKKDHDKSGTGLFGKRKMIHST